MQSIEPATLGRVGPRLRTPRAAGVAGIVFAALFTISILLLRSHPGPGSTAEEIAVWYLRNDTGRLVIVGLYIVPFAGLPRWLALAGYPIALVLLLAVDYLEPIVLVFPAWVVAVSVMILRAARTSTEPVGA